jgi:hypothetical protein
MLVVYGETRDRVFPANTSPHTFGVAPSLGQPPEIFQQAEQLADLLVNTTLPETRPAGERAEDVREGRIP